jgi:hypothetical protein
MVRGTPQIDPHDLLAAIEAESHEPSHDFRTRVLIRDSMLALERHWTRERAWDSLSPSARAVVNRIVNNDLGAPGFPTIGRRMMERTDRDTILRFLRELGERTLAPARIELGGSGVLILDGLLRRGT